MENQNCLWEFKHLWHQPKKNVLQISDKMAVEGPPPVVSLPTKAKTQNWRIQVTGWLPISLRPQCATRKTNISHQPWKEGTRTAFINRGLRRGERSGAPKAWLKMEQLVLFLLVLSPVFVSVCISFYLIAWISIYWRPSVQRKF